MKPEDTLRFRLARFSDKPALINLLKQCYEASSDFIITDNTYFEDQFGADQCVFVAEINGAISAIMCASLIQKENEFKDEHEGHLDAKYLPALCLLREATHSSARTLGLNSMLRLYALEAAIRLQLKGSICVVYDGSPRTRLMSEIGYQIFPLAAEGDDHFRNLTPCCFAVVDLERDGKNCVQKLKSHLAATLMQSLWEGPTIDSVLGSNLQQRQ